MNKYWFCLIWAFSILGCDLGPSTLNLGEPPRTNAQGELDVPLNVTKVFSPTGYFYNVWAPADSTFTEVDPEKWNNFLAYQSVYQHPSCADRVRPETLAVHDTTLYTTPTGFYSEFNCSQFTYAPVASDDLYGGVFWLRHNNFGDRPGTPVAAGARYVRFWARSLFGQQTVKFGIGVYNSSSLKPWYYFSKFVDTFGDPNEQKQPLFEKRKLPNSAGQIVDSVVVVDSVLSGTGLNNDIRLSDQWRLYEIDLISLYGFMFKPDGTPFDALPPHKLIGAFYWAIETTRIRDSSRVTSPFRLPDGTTRRAKYGSATILIDGIRYEK